MLHTSCFTLHLYPTPNTQVISISYSSYELSYYPDDDGYLQTFDATAMGLGAMGVTLLSAAGDDGVSGYLARGSPLFCGYYPQFPATSPYVTAVGGTQGPESGAMETVCMSDATPTGVITTGGGFSQYYPTPAWQASAVGGYLTYIDENKDSMPQQGVLTNLNICSCIAL